MPQESSGDEFTVPKSCNHERRRPVTEGRPVGTRAAREKQRDNLEMAAICGNANGCVGVGVCCANLRRNPNPEQSGHFGEVTVARSTK